MFYLIWSLTIQATQTNRFNQLTQSAWTVRTLSSQQVIKQRYSRNSLPTTTSAPDISAVEDQLQSQTHSPVAAFARTSRHPSEVAPTLGTVNSHICCTVQTSWPLCGVVQNTKNDNIGIKPTKTGFITSYKTAKKAYDTYSLTDTYKLSRDQHNTLRTLCQFSEAAHRRFTSLDKYKEYKITAKSSK